MHKFAEEKYQENLLRRGKGLAKTLKEFRCAHAHLKTGYHC